MQGTLSSTKIGQYFVQVTKRPIVYIKNGDVLEMDMMSVRWKIFHFNVRIQEKDQRENVLQRLFYTELNHFS